ncbi:TPR-like protein [Delitschia confertaspora ATCC 74209]|uniref:TPR-like protein n=1 Tax=Delitschia confertaspora ATCC 74209 TaxID=1513339 RepID=A0A9P4MNN5_9PLEO|nr:TPR-like protein [Delitschia confertaspora ATCC 74209]
MEKFLRNWRQDALNKHQYESAIFIGDKLLALTSDDNDAFWLAQVHFSTGNYTRALSFLSRGELIPNNSSCRYLAAHCCIKQGKFDEALAILGDKNPVHLISPPGAPMDPPAKLRHVSVSRLTGRTQKNGSKTDRVPTSEERENEDIKNIRFEAAMCYLRGVCYAKQNSFDRAKECYKDAVRIDVQCFEAFDQLMKNSLMSPEEEWKFLESLNFDSVEVDGNANASQEAAQFTKMLYTTRLSKYHNPAEFTTATETLSTHYNLSSNPDILLAKADLLFTQCRFQSALQLTSSIIQIDRYNFSAMPIHLACLHELGETNALFLLAHELVDAHPEEPCAWLAIGVYYLSISRIAEARRYFSKASMMDPHFGPAWIGFAHTFAAEGEHDQAISAYSTAARLFQGTHLPQLFLGMQNLQLNNLQLAQEYLNAAHKRCKSDPLLLNEMGVAFYHEDNLEEAIRYFNEALRLADELQSDTRAWLPTRTNLGHAYRRAGRLEDALEEFEVVLRAGNKDAGVFTAKGMVLLEMGRSWDAVEALHQALAVSPQDPIATDLLNRALEQNETESMGRNDLVGWAGAETSMSGIVASDDEVDELERKISDQLKQIERSKVTGRRGRRGRNRGGGLEMDVDMSVDGMTGGESMMVDSDG